MRLSGKGALVTGGGRGIGAAIARALAAEGAAVVVSARGLTEIKQVAEDLRAQGGRAFAVGCDVTRPEEVARLLELAREHLGEVDILVNNAGVATAAPIKAQTLEEWQHIFAVNVTGTFLCTQAALQHMVEGGWGRIVNIASVAALSGGRYISAYAASKHAVMGFTRSVAIEVAGRGVTINAVCPGYVDTDMTRASVARIVERTGMSEEQALNALKKTNPQNRLLSPHEVAAVTVWLCLPESHGVNGQAIVLDGGGFAG